MYVRRIEVCCVCAHGVCVCGACVRVGCVCVWVHKFIYSRYSQITLCLFFYIVITFFHFLMPAATGAAAPGCSRTVNAAD